MTNISELSRLYQCAVESRRRARYLDVPVRVAQAQDAEVQENYDALVAALPPLTK